MIEEKIILVGTLEKIFRTFPDGTLVGSFLQTNTNERIKIIGQIINVRVHQTLHIKGLWDHHPKYGLQFKVSEFKTEEPITREGIVKYLASGEFAGIGIKTSERIYEMFGDKTFDIIDKDPEKLLNVKNFNRKQLTSVQKVRKNQQEERSVITYLRGKFISK
ncbi:MAG: ATP-dependent RecD-like DNA helicase, partial [SAR324 cluster bacterium]|nr:ATP-dependent RecD-like DNA helicase [SAR324 cluster bacterium]